MRSVSNQRLPYLEQTFVSLAPNNPSLVPAFASLPNSQKNYSYSNQMREIIQKINQVAEIASDHSLSAENLSFQFMLDFYNTAKRGADRNVPGANSVVDELSPLFEQDSNTPAVPNP